MRGLTREELSVLRDTLQTPDKMLTVSEVEISERLVEQGRGTKVTRENENYYWDVYDLSEQGREALRLYSLIGERMLL